LANHKSALKRARQSEIRRLRNKGYKTRVKNIVKEVQKAADANVPEEAQAAFIKAVSTIQKTASKGVIHKNTAARKVSRLARRINQIEAS
jgi:small subunit ribosomal protein S20